MRVQGVKNQFVLLAFKASALCLKCSTAESKHEKMRKKISHLSVSSITDASIQQSQDIVLNIYFTGVLKTI